jgi:hypothetical protein
MSATSMEVYVSVIITGALPVGKKVSSILHSLSLRSQVSVSICPSAPDSILDRDFKTPRFLIEQTRDSSTLLKLRVGR